MLVDPEHGDYRLQPASPAQGYGCQTFGPRSLSREFRDNLQAAPAPTLRVARFDAGGVIRTDTVWDADTVRVTGDVLVADGITLSIAPGVRVEFQGYYALRVAGRLLAIGTSTSPIDFTHAHPELFAVDTTRVGCWHGIRFDRTSALNDSSRLEYCRLRCSKAVGAEDRGAVIYDCGFSKLRIANCVFEHNVGGYGAAIFCDAQAAPTIVGCLIRDNHALRGGSAICSFYSYPKVTACTIVSNEVRNDEICYGTAAIESFIGKPWVRGNVIVMNTSHYFLGGQIYEGKPLYVTFNDIEDGYAGEGDFNADPMFLDSGEHPYRLRSDSPCINAGPPDIAGLRLPAFDLAGAPRVWNGRLDVGAYEWSDPAGIGTDAAPPAIAQLQIAPNPGGFGGAATILTFNLNRPAQATLTVYDAAGRLVVTLLDAFISAGRHEVRWDGSEPALDPGAYFCRLTVGGREAGTTKLLHLAR